MPGPVVVFDIDGVLADMRDYEHLIEGRYSRTRWNRFHKHFGDARVIRRNANLLTLLVDAKLQIVYSTTRPEASAQATWDWLAEEGLPQGPILTRHAVLDGQRFAESVKVRHWYYWLDNRANVNPVVGWIEDEPDARDKLAENGCPAWDPDRLRRLLARNKDVPAIRILTERVNPSPPELAANLDANAAAWREAQTEWEARQRSSWLKRRRREREQRPPTRREK